MRKLGLALFVCLGALLVLVALLPVVETNAWWIRYLDFVRLQAGIALAVILMLGLVLGAWRHTIGAATLAAGLLALGYQGFKLHPYTPLVRPMAATVRFCPTGAAVKLMVSNVRKGNRDFEAFRRVVDVADPDVLLALETDGWWDEKLQALRPRYPNVVPSLPRAAEYYGLHFLSKLPLGASSVEFYFDDRTPTVVASVQLPAGAFTFIGLHPRPPQSFGQPTTLRDGTLAKAAFAAADGSAPAVVAGDLNAVSWERILRRAMRVGGLLDPSVGRGFFASYSATNPVMAWPLDHVLFQGAFGLMDFRTLPSVGSDHYPVMATLCLQPDPAARQPAPPPRLGDRDELRRAMERAESTE